MAFANAPKSGYTQQDLAAMGPVDAERLRRLAQALLTEGEPEIRNPLQGLAYMADKLNAQMANWQAYRQEKAGRQSATDTMASLFPVFPPAPPTPGGGGGAGLSGASQATTTGSAAAAGGSALESYIRQAAAARGIDPDVAVTVAKHEGGLSDPFRHGEGPAPKSQAPGLGATENSIGPFQLYVSGTGAGLGDRALAAGIDPRKDWQRGIDFALDEVRRKGWGQWYGAKAAGITGMQGVGAMPPAAAPAQVASLDPTAGMTPSADVGVGAVPTPAPRPAPVQMAQALTAQPVDPAQTLGAPVYDSAAGPDLNALAQATGNQWMNSGQQNLIEALIGQKLHAADPAYQLDIAEKRAQLGMLPVETAIKQAQLRRLTGGSFQGDSMDAQAWNILQTADPTSKEYATAYSIVSQPKTQLVQTANGMMPVQVPPQLPAWLKAPPGREPVATPSPDAATSGAPAPATAANIAATGTSGAASAAGVIPGTQPQPQETQRRYQMLYRPAAAELPNVLKNWGALGTTANQVGGMLPGASKNFATTPEYQSAFNSVRTIIANFLYATSGAQQSPKEIDEQTQLLMPTMGESKLSRDDKLRRIQGYVDTMRQASGLPDEAPAAGIKEEVWIRGPDGKLTRQSQ